jgi:DNA topoisomerase III
MIVVLAEKPSVARDLAAVLGATARREGFLEGGGYRVTWALGHLVRLAEPGEIDPAWKTWSRSALPMLPSQFPLEAIASARAQYRIVAKLLRDRETKSLIAATDAGREGELIFRYVYEHARCRKPWVRLWLSSLTPAAIRTALSKLEPGAHFDGLAAAARARSQADWLVGMNFSRAYTITSGTLYSVGRVQTPTLAMVVQRDEDIRRFVAQPYLEVEATFASSKGTYRGTYYEPPEPGLRDTRGRLRPFDPLRARLPADGELAATIAARARAGTASVGAIESQLRQTRPPQLYDLTELQRDANRLYGLSAQRTLDAAQALYETHKAISYPRTDSRHLSTAVAETLPAILRAITPMYEGLIAASTGKPLGKRWVDDTKVSDHHALIPTPQRPALRPSSPEALVYDLVCRRLLMAWHADLVESITRLLTEVRDREGPNTTTAPPLLFATQGTVVQQPGWTVLNPLRRERSASPAAPQLPKIPSGLVRGDAQQVTDVQIHRKQTQPPKPYTEATLLSAMEGAGRQIDDEALREAMRDSGLGTPATRAAIIETLLTRGYLTRAAKVITSTPLGAALIGAVHPLVCSPELTGRWEQRLRRMERGEDTLDAFMRDIATYVREVVTVEATKPMNPRRSAPKRQRTSRPAKKYRRRTNARAYRKRRPVKRPE